MATTTGGHSDRVKRIALAIANQEGFNVPGSVAQRNHNPGNLTNLSGAFQVFVTDSEGWEALYRYVERMLSGEGLYPAGITIEEASRIYTGTQQQEWAANVAAYLGVSINTPMEVA